MSWENSSGVEPMVRGDSRWVALFFGNVQNREESRSLIDPDHADRLSFWASWGYVFWIKRMQKVLNFVEWEKRSILEKIGIVYIAGLGLFFVFGISYRAVVPLTCEQAQAVLQEKRSAASRAGADAQMYHITDVKDAYDKTQEACR